MPTTSTDYQPTRLTVPGAGSPTGPSAGAAPRARAGRSKAIAGTGPEAAPPPTRVGVVFVHGIGTQQPSETFLDWSAPIVELLTDWRRAIGEPGDPVVRSEFSFSGASQPYLEVAIPAHGDRLETRWVLTEAWWAADLRAPALGTVVDYLSRRLGRVIAGIAQGYRGRETTWRTRRSEARSDVGAADSTSAPAAAPVAAAARELRPNPRWAWIDGLDRLQARAFSLGLLVTALTAVGTVALVVWGLLRRIPIGPVRDFAEARIIDSFLVDWFGDLPVLLDDPVQAANVRARLTGSIDALRADGCDAIVLIAHSGGAIVAYETLLDPAFADRPVDTLITHGQGLALAWRLAQGPDGAGLARGNRLLGDLRAARPDLRWVDVWSSYDPAPAGPLPTTVPGAPLELADPPLPWPDRRPAGAPELVESRPVTNRMNILRDHGAYWANEEGFVGAVLRHVDAARQPLDRARFYGDPVARAVRIERRRQRVAGLAAWGWVCSVLAGASVAVGLVGDLGARFRAGGEAVVAAWNVVPGHEVVSGPIDAGGRVLGSVAAALGLGRVADALAPIGPAVVAASLAIGLFFVLAGHGNGRWDAWDLVERRAARPEVLVPTDRGWAAAEACALVGGAIGLAAAIATALPVAAVAPIVTGAIAGLLVRWRTGSPNAATRAIARLVADR